MEKFITIRFDKKLFGYTFLRGGTLYLILVKNKEREKKTLLVDLHEKTIFYGWQCVTETFFSVVASRTSAGYSFLVVLALTLHHFLGKLKKFDIRSFTTTTRRHYWREKITVAYTRYQVTRVEILACEKRKEKKSGKIVKIGSCFIVVGLSKKNRFNFQF